MTWTTTTPTEEGWYWFKHPKYGGGEWRPCKVWDKGPVWYCEMNGWVHRLDKLPLDAQWQRIEEPE